jgi:G3E family GTPase
MNEHILLIFILGFARIFMTKHHKGGKMEGLEERDYRRQKIIEEAVEAADRIILNGSDGSEEETDYLTAMVAEKLIRRAFLPFQRKLLDKDIKDSLLAKS